MAFQRSKPDFSPLAKSEKSLEVHNNYFEYESQANESIDEREH